MALDGMARLIGVTVETPALPKKLEGIDGEVRFATRAPR